MKRPCAACSILRSTGKRSNTWPSRSARRQSCGSGCSVSAEDGFHPQWKQGGAGAPCSSNFNCGGSNRPSTKPWASCHSGHRGDAPQGQRWPTPRARSPTAPWAIWPFPSARSEPGRPGPSCKHKDGPGRHSMAGAEPLPAPASAAAPRRAWRRVSPELTPTSARRHPFRSSPPLCGCTRRE
jgi:hypothetical protein